MTIKPDQVRRRCSARTARRATSRLPCTRRGHARTTRVCARSGARRTSPSPANDNSGRTGSGSATRSSTSICTKSTPSSTTRPGQAGPRKARPVLAESRCRPSRSTRSRTSRVRATTIGGPVKDNPSSARSGNIHQWGSSSSEHVLAVTSAEWARSGAPSGAGPALGSRTEGRGRHDADVRHPPDRATRSRSSSWRRSCVRVRAATFDPLRQVRSVPRPERAHARGAPHRLQEEPCRTVHAMLGDGRRESSVQRRRSRPVRPGT